MTTTEKPKNFTLISYKKNTGRVMVLKRVGTRSKIKFRKKLNLLPNEFDVYLRVSYWSGSWNDGDYFTKKDLMLAFNAFIE
jgi:hypothetical protein